MASQKVLVCGGGVAGSIVAFWLAKHDYQVTVVERSRAEQKLGQGIEIEEPALTVVREMGILDKLRERKTIEAGTKVVNQHGSIWAKFDASGISPTGELELMRGDLTEVLYKAADTFSNVTYRFETVLRSLSQTQDKVTVELENRKDKTTTTEEFDLVIGADGARSRTRQLIMGPDEETKCFKPVGAYVSYFSIPREDKDWPYSKVCQFTGRRLVWMRPTGKESDETSVYLIYVKDKDAALQKANATGDRTKQKEAFAEVFRGLGWETPRVIEQMMKSNNFYSDELMQVKLPRWSQDRVVLLGDSAWAPTPFTGQGNQLAIIGAWVLAQEMTRDRTPAAFQKYEQRLRSYVEQCQEIPLNGRMPKLACPQTSWGISLIRVFVFTVSWVLRFISWAGWTSKVAEQQVEHFDLEVEKMG